MKYKHYEEQWIPLQILKEADPVQTTEFTKAMALDAAVIIKKAPHKYGIEVYATVEYDKQIDVINGNYFNQYAIDKEVENIAVALEILERGKMAPIGCKKLGGHLVFDANMDFIRYGRLMKDGYQALELNQSTFVGVVSRESTRKALTYVALNNIEVNAADIENANLQATLLENTTLSVVTNLV